MLDRRRGRWLVGNDGIDRARGAARPKATAGGYVIVLFAASGKPVNEQLEVSVVVPLYNEADSLPELHARLSEVLSAEGDGYEILFINDGSTDDSAKVLDELAGADVHVGVVHFRRNFGKAAALDAGFKRARGKLVATLDADLQDAPEELPKMFERLRRGFDMVSGWKKRRKDPLGKRIPSRLFNFVVSRISGLKLHDFNCGLKAYRAEAISGLSLYGEMHRYIPVLLHWRGFRVTEMAVEHAPRKHGKSKYGIERFARGFFDLLTVLLNTRYRARPLHLFGFGGLLMGGMGTLILVYLTVLWFLGERPIGDRPLLLLGLLLVMVGVQLVSTGLLGELIHRASIHTKEDPYVIRTDIAPRAGAQQLPEVSDQEPHRAAPARALSGAHRS